jgi:hypothetical protein
MYGEPRRFVGRLFVGKLVVRVGEIAWAFTLTHMFTVALSVITAKIIYLPAVYSINSHFIPHMFYIFFCISCSFLYNCNLIYFAISFTFYLFTFCLDQIHLISSFVSRDCFYSHCIQAHNIFPNPGTNVPT